MNTTASGGAAPTVLGIAESATLSGSTITNYAPGAMMYAAVGSDNNTHIYGLNLASATTPVAVQMSNISFSNATSLCDWSTAQHNFFQPTSFFLLVHIGGTNGCSTTTGNGDVWEVVEWGASATSAPAVVNITTTDVKYFYGPSGALTGAVLLDPASKNVYFYTSDAFTAPATIASNMAYASDILFSDTGSQSSLSFAGSFLFEAFTAVTSNVQSLYRINYDGTSANEYTAVNGLGGGVADSSNMYFTDGGEIFAEPLAGGTTPLKLYNGPVDWGLVGSNGSLLVLQSSGATGTGYAGTVATIPTGTLTSTPTLLGGTPNSNNESNYTGLVDVNMVEGTSGSPSSSVVFINVHTPSGTGTTTTVSYASAAYLPNGTVKQGLTNNSAFLAQSGALTTTVFSVSGITDSAYPTGFSTYGGGAVDVVNVSSFAATAMKTSGGTAYTVPAGSFPELEVVSPYVGLGFSYTPGSGSTASTDSGLAFDISKDLIVPVTVANSNVTSF